MRKLVSYIVLIILCLFVLGPFIWMLATSVKPSYEIFSTHLQLFPSHWMFSNYVKAWKSAPFGRYFLNSFIVAATQTVFSLFFGSLAAFAFARFRFPGRQLLFVLLLITMMVPGEILLIPNYITIARLHWLSTYQALIVPWLVSVFTIFLMRQYFISLPQELFEAADLDGCSIMRVLFRILLPLTRPIWITAGLISFTASWNGFLWVLVVTNNPNIYTLPVGLINFSTDVGTAYNQLMAATAFSVVPLIILFLLGQRYFIQGIARSGLR